MTRMGRRRDVSHAELLDRLGDALLTHVPKPERRHARAILEVIFATWRGCLVEAQEDGRAAGRAEAAAQARRDGDLGYKTGYQQAVLHVLGHTGALALRADDDHATNPVN